MSRDRPGLATRILQRAVDVRPEETSALLLSCAYHFFILSSYYILRPIRDEAAVFSGVRNLPWLFTGTLVLMLLAHPPFAALVAKLPRTRFISYTYRFFIANLLVFFALLSWAPEGADLWIGRAFYWWVSVFNLFVVSIFWAFMADVFRNEQGKRMFGFVALGGTLGAIVGAATTASLVEHIGPVYLILISVVLLELAVWCVRRLSARGGPTRRALPEESGIRVGGLPETEPGRGYAVGPAESKAEEPIGGGVLAGITHVFRSPYLLGICAYMLLYTIAATFLYFQQTWIVEETIADRAVRTAFFAKIDLAVNVLAIFTQAFLTGRFIKWLGVAVTLTLLPAVCVLGFSGLGLWPFLGVLVVFQTLRRAGNYAVARPTREVLYTVVNREEKYKAKNFIDTFVYRGGDQVGAWAYGGMMWFGFGMSVMAFVAVPLCAVWLAVGYWLGRRQEALARRQARGDVAVQPAAAVL
ncbi:MAG: MFS transporter [Gemmatimonadota bacterium]|nr:MAG: MFS transporter [Gemmatimonadota bacterium]